VILPDFKGDSDSFAANSVPPVGARFPWNIAFFVFLSFSLDYSRVEAAADARRQRVKLYS